MCSTFRFSIARLIVSFNLVFIAEMDVWPVYFYVTGGRISQFSLDFITGGFLFTQPNQTTSLSPNREPHFNVIFFSLSIVHYYYIPHRIRRKTELFLQKYISSCFLKRFSFFFFTMTHFELRSIKVGEKR